ncbi:MULTISPECIES: acyltransferase [Rhodomicrobium]|uniref:acyltransferase family protein n=1 Tax=Rhodomicrobium TaxID=1068 RepID=UPI000B4A6C78|nr:MULTISPECIES: acyltransferase [Rhodomicrobium]
MIYSIQYLRALAACMVVFFHAADHLVKYFAIPSVYAVGAAGVDIFFVISGLIMWLTTAGKPISPGSFMWRRITRIVPLYWLVTLVMFAMPFVSGTIAGGMPADPNHLLASMLFIPRPSPVDPSMYFPVYTPGWTINFEMFFYVIFSLCLLASTASLRAGALLAALTGLVAAGLILSPGGVLGWLASPILLEFAAGVAIGAMYTSGVVLPRTLAWIALIGGGLALLGLGLAGATLHTRVILWGIPAIFIVLGALYLERHGAVREVPFLRLLGDASYSLYLTHLFAVGAVAVVWHKFDLWHTTEGGAAFFLAAFAASIVLALLSYFYVETPLLKLSRILRPGIIGQPVKSNTAL